MSSDRMKGLMDSLVTFWLPILGWIVLIIAIFVVGLSQKLVDF